jgi:type VI secretion system secreted protein VgrG
MDAETIALTVGESSLVLKKDGKITLTGKELTFIGEEKILSVSPQIRDND